MRSLVLIALVSLAFGIFGACLYGRYFGQDQQLAELQAQLDAVNAQLAKAAQESRQAGSDAETMSAQIKQLTSEKEAGKQQVEQSKSNEQLAGHLSELQKRGKRDSIYAQAKFELFKSRFHLTPDQEAALKAALAAGKSVDQALNDILTPDQKKANEQFQANQKINETETGTLLEMSKVTAYCNLSDTQKDQVYSALADIEAEMQDPTWVAAHVTAPTTSNAPTVIPTVIGQAENADPVGTAIARAQAQEDALSKILTPEQLSSYQQMTQHSFAVGESPDGGLQIYEVPHP